MKKQPQKGSIVNECERDLKKKKFKLNWIRSITSSTRQQQQQQNQTQTNFTPNNDKKKGEKNENRKHKENIDT